jgi:hypothetical protein
LISLIPELLTMMNIKKLPFHFFCIAALSILFFSTANAQSKPKKRVAKAATVKRTVILKTNAGDEIVGNLISSDSQKVTIDVLGKRRVFSLDEVNSLVFEPNAMPKINPGASTLEALKALRKLSSAIEVGISYIQYRELLINAKAAVNESLTELPNGAIRESIANAMDAFADAGDIWSATFEKFGAERMKLWERVKVKYSFSDDWKERIYFDKDTRLLLPGPMNFLWQSANKNIAFVDSLVKK